MHESSNHSVKEKGWWRVTPSVFIKRHILGEEQLHTATFSAKNYGGMLENFMAADWRRLCSRNIWFNKVTTSYASTVSVDILRNIMFAKHMVQQGYYILCIYSFCRYSAEHYVRETYGSTRLLHPIHLQFL